MNEKEKISPKNRVRKTLLGKETKVEPPPISPFFSKRGGDVKEKSAIPKDKLAMHWASLTLLYSIDSTDGSSMLPCRREGHLAD
ncbi:hypothetical protein TNCT_164101 [Trichonephila clavata]|uniref:Uncharacterized protein n=1 Tax=Trichonephila clavata TaxID=2740835 RepID=A0A8X6GLF2_TRICU|nr:hypothetical protein TNCT_164101 [Trichonephila clavata]